MLVFYCVKIVWHTLLLLKDEDSDLSELAVAETPLTESEGSSTPMQAIKVGGCGWVGGCGGGGVFGCVCVCVCVYVHVWYNHMV